MPGGDRTGPLGQGSMTGRAAGYCAGFNTPGYANPMAGRGFGRGFGRGMGFGRGRGFGLRQGDFAPVERVVPVYRQPVQPTKEQEKQALENDITAIEQEKKILEQEMESIKKRLEEIKSQQ
ncbi:MAG: DUF5320 domain-containing protein [Nanoarchaeota archaeon]|nr:DUF5320 domain-containing protein [Nanoarchaeota archaeon]